MKHTYLKPVAAASTFLLGVPAATVALADPFEGGYYNHYGMMDWGGWVFGPIMMRLFFALLVGAIVLIVRLLGGSPLGANGSSHDRALTILRERFAKGEITQEEFEKGKSALG